MARAWRRRGAGVARAWRELPCSRGSTGDHFPDALRAPILQQGKFRLDEFGAEIVRLSPPGPHRKRDSPAGRGTGVARAWRGRGADVA